MSHYVQVPFEEAILDATGGNPKVLTSALSETGRFPVVDQGQEFVSGYVDDEELLCRRGNDAVILFGDHTKIIKYIDFDFVLGADGVKVLEARPGFDPRFLFHYLNTICLPSDLGYSRHFKYLKRAAVPKPPIEEQRRIAAILDKADAIRKRRGEALKLADDFLNSAFADLCRPKVESIALSGIAEVITGFAFRSESYTNALTDIRLIRGTNVGTGQFDWSETAFYPRGLTGNLERFSIGAGDVLLAMDRPWISSGLKCCIASAEVEGSLLVQRVARIRPKNGIDSEFIFRCLNSNQFVSHCRVTETTIPHISPSDLASFLVPSVHRSDKERFGKLARQVRKMAVGMASQLVEAAHAFNALSHQAFCGQL